MSDTNVHRVVGNLLVGTSHFFVDTTTNQVGINTSSPSASLDVATGDVKVGSGITLASSTGTITATGGFSGNGSGLTGVNSDSGSWVNGSSSNIHLAVSTDKVGIGTVEPESNLHVVGTTRFETTSNLVDLSVTTSQGDWTPFSTELTTPSSTGIAVSSDGRTMVVRGQTSSSVAVYKYNNPSAQWVQLGSDIVGTGSFGTATNDTPKTPISLSSDGTRVVVGSDDVNKIYIYQYDTTNGWQLMSGGEITGTTAAGYSVSISGDGSKVAFGDSDEEVRVYHYDTTWQQLGSTISDASSTASLFGESVSLSENGQRLAIGAHKDDTKATDAGVVRIYEYDNTNGWQLMIGGALYGGKKFFGYTVSLSSDGSKLVTTSKEDTFVYEYVAGRIHPWMQMGSHEIGTDNIITQVGSDLNGNAAGDRFGYHVSMSSDGTRMGVMAEYTASIVRIYEYDNSSSLWNQVGGDLDENDNEFGTSISMSSDGMRVAIGTYRTNNNSGSVRIYEYDASKTVADANGPIGWDQLGGDIVGDANTQAATSISMSSDGTRVVFGARAATVGGRIWVGHARIYDYNASKTVADANGPIGWDKVGGDIEGDMINYFRFGESVSLSSDGTHVAISNDYSSAEKVRIFKYDATKTSAPAKWAQVGDDLDGVQDDEGFGFKVSLSSDGLRVAVSAPENSRISFKSGQTRVYEYDAVLAQWGQLGNSIDLIPWDSNLSTNAYYSGWSISLSGDGTRVAVGMYLDNPASSSPHRYGTTRIYQYDPRKRDWFQIGHGIRGEHSGDWSAYSISMSGDGRRIVVPSYRHPNETEVGKVRVFELPRVHEKGVIAGNVQWNEMMPNASISGDGSRVLVTTEEKNSQGVVRVYDYNSQGNLWIQNGKTFYGKKYGALPRATLSRDGNCMGIVPDYLAGGITFYEYESPQLHVDGGVRVRDTLTVDGGLTVANSISTSKETVSNVIQLKKTLKAEPHEHNPMGGFGRSTCMSGDGNYIVVTNYLKSDNIGYRMGAAYVYKWNGYDWAYQQKLTAQMHNTQGNDEDIAFGDYGSVGIDHVGSKIAIGARRKHGNLDDTGAIFAWTRVGESWGNYQEIYGAIEDSASFGYRSTEISADGNYLVGGALDKNQPSNDEGVVNVYKWENNTWTFKQQIVNNVGQTVDDFFGAKISLTSDGSRLFVGFREDYKDQTPADDQGAVAWYDRSGETFTYQGIIKAGIACLPHNLTIVHGGDAGENDYFGEHGLHTSPDGTWVAIAAAYHNPNSFDGDQGAVYIYKYEGSNYVQKTKVMGSFGFRNRGSSFFDHQEHFGFNCKISDDATKLLVCGHDYGFDGSNGYGAGYFFTRADTATDIWKKSSIIVEDPLYYTGSNAINLEFGLDYDMSADGSKFIIGQPWKEGGTAYIYSHGEREETTLKIDDNLTIGKKLTITNDRERTVNIKTSDHLGADVWSYGAPVNESDKINHTNETNERFGWRLEMDAAGDYVLVSANHSDQPYDTGNDQGAVYLYKFDGNGWVRQFSWIGTGLAADTHFGYGLAMNDDATLIAIGSFRHNEVQIWKRGSKPSPSFSSFEELNPDPSVETTWTKYGNDLTDNSLSSFGANVVMSGDGKYIAVSAHEQDIVYVYTMDGTNNSYLPVVTLTPSGASGSEHFGWGLSMSKDGKWIAVGDYDEENGGHDRGAVYVFRRIGETTWDGPTKINSPHPNDDGWFGYSVDLDDMGRTLVVSAPGENGAGTDSGKVYVFERSGNRYNNYFDNKWTEHQEISGTDAETDAYFGLGTCKVSGDGTYLFVNTHNGRDQYGAYRGGDLHVYRRQSGSSYILIKILGSQGLADNARFGSFGLAFNKDVTRIMVGAYLDDEPTDQDYTGNMFFFTRTRKPVLEIDGDVEIKGTLNTNIDTTNLKFNGNIGSPTTMTKLFGGQSYPDRPIAMVGRNDGRVYSTDNPLGNMVGQYIWNVIGYNDHGLYNSSTGRFTAPPGFPGYYLFTFTGLGGLYESPPNTRWWRNGSVFNWGAAHVNDSGTSSRRGLSCQVLIYLDEGDFVTKEVHGASIYGSSEIHSTTLAIYLGDKY